MAVTAKFPGTAGVSALALTDVGGEMSGIPFNEWTANGATTAVAVAPFSLVSNEAIDTTVPTQGWVTTANGEVLHYSTYVAGTKTFTIDARAQFGTVAAAIDTGSAFGQWLNKQQWNQVVAEIIAMQTKLLVGDAPNLVLNSDFSRRTVFGLAMPEVFADLSGTTKIDGGAAGAVAANIFTQGAANNEYAWCAGSFVWRDGRASATFKATAIAGIYEQRWRISATDYISVKQNNGNMTITKFIASALTVVSTVANVLTINKWYWIELEKQGTTVTVRMYDTGGTVPGVTKASSTLIAGSVLTATIADASVAVGASVSITSDQAAAQWGGIATGNGGVYVETWLPESFAYTFAGTLGGQAIGFDEAADSGPNVAGAPYKQWAIRGYIPAASRTIYLNQHSPDGSIAASTAYAGSAYMKVSGLGGSGALVDVTIYDETSAQASLHTIADMVDAGVTSWTRKSATATAAATSRRAQTQIAFNAPATATGTGFVQLVMLEQGSAATAWRGAPADDAPFSIELLGRVVEYTTTSATAVEVDSRDLAIDLFMPWDGVVALDAECYQSNSVAATLTLGCTIDGSTIFTTAGSKSVVTAGQAGASQMISFAKRRTLAAGKHRIALTYQTSAGTLSFSGTAADQYLRITATRGK